VDVTHEQQAAVLEGAIATPKAGGRRRRAVLSYLWVLPAILLYALFTLTPLIAGIYLSLLRWDGIKPATYIGLANYERMLHDEKLRDALMHNVQYAVGTVIGKNLLALGLALLLNQALRGRAVYRTALFLPVVMSFVVVGILWTWIYNDDFGLVNNLLRSVHLGGLAQDWLGDTRLALWSLIAVDIWKWYGFHMVIYLAGLQTIPTEFYEAAKLDGATRWRQLTGITLPLLKPVIVVNVTLSLLGAMNVFDIPYVMTEGGPANSTNVTALHMYIQAFKFNRLGYGAAISYGLFTLITVIALIQLKLMSRNASEY
jgi:raffinose/stachyose/melibiose transport system permease protein